MLLETLMEARGAWEGRVGVRGTRKKICKGAIIVPLKGLILGLAIVLFFGT